MKKSTLQEFENKNHIVIKQIIKKTNRITKIEIKYISISIQTRLLF